MIFILCRFNPQLGPAGPKTTIKQKIGSLRLTWPVVLLFVLIIGGIYGGIFTAAEAGAIGAFGALVISLVKRQMTRSSFVNCLLETAEITGMMIALIIGAFIFKQFLAVTRIPFVFSDWVAGLEINKYVIVGIIVVVYIILGSIFDIYAIIVMTTPIIFPTMQALGFNPLWFGVIMVRLMEMGEITPPFGFNLFALSGSIEEIRITDLYRGVVPFLIADVLHIALLVAIPTLSTILPEIMIEK